MGKRDMKQIQGIIQGNSKIADHIYLMTIKAPEISETARPGNFILISLGTTYDPLLRRPMSISNVKGDHLQILYQLVGRGTVQMSRFKVHDEVNIIGPLGNGFNTDKSGSNLLIGGGIGVAPLIFLYENLLKKGRPAKFIVGMKSRELDGILAGLEGEIEIARENSPNESSKLVTDLLEPVLKENKIDNIYCCGPEQMYGAIKRICADYSDIFIQVSLDRHMACGVGACMGCVVPVRKKDRKESVNLRACVEGPIFDLEEVILDA